MTTRVFTPGCSISGMAEIESSAAGTVLVTPSSKVTMADTSIDGLFERSTYVDLDQVRPAVLIDTGFLSRADVRPPIGTMLVCKKSM